MTIFNRCSILFLLKFKIVAKAKNRSLNSFPLDGFKVNPSITKIIPLSRCAAFIVAWQHSFQIALYHRRGYQIDPQNQLVDTLYPHRQRQQGLMSPTPNDCDQP